MKQRFYVSLHFIIPFIFAGLAAFSGIVAFQITRFFVAKGADTTFPVTVWVVGIAAVAFFVGFVIARLVLGPVKGFMQKLREVPALSVPDIDRGKTREVDELKHFALVFDQVADVLNNVDAQHLYPGIVGQSDSMRKVLSRVMMVAPTNSSVLIIGEKGTGKDLVATNIFDHSLRKMKPFIKIDCRDKPEGIFESELFGHEKGYFSGAASQSPGQIEMAQGGVLLFDEIGALPLPIQEKVLRLLQKGEFNRPGGRKTYKADVRVIATTTRDIAGLVEKGKFDPALYYRINIFSIYLPPLRDRKRDIPQLVDHFLMRAPGRAQISSSAMQLLMAYGWPGNVAELEDTIEKSSAVSRSGIIEVSDLPRAVKEGPTQRVEAMLQHAQRMEAIGTIASGISHNFRNILSGISLNNQLVQLKYGGDNKLKEISGSINNFINRGTQVIEELMLFSRKQPERKFESLDLVGILQETYNLIRESFDKKIEITMDLAEKLPVVGSRSGLSQVFMNLCTNARDAMPEGGLLSLRAEEKNGKAEVTIGDSGEGMDPETREKCFDPFYTTKDVGKGTGLGLSTTYGIVKNHGGDVTVESEPGKGSVFLVSFPLDTTGSRRAEEEAQQEIVRGGGHKVLVVDDEADSLKPMEEMLEALGYEPFTSASASQGIDDYKKRRPDVVLMDRNMPEMDGTQAARVIFEHDPNARIILVSGYDEDGVDGINDEEKSLIRGYLTKPVELGGLSRMLSQVIGPEP